MLPVFACRLVGAGWISLWRAECVANWPALMARFEGSVSGDCFLKGLRRHRVGVESILTKRARISMLTESLGSNR